MVMDIEERTFKFSTNLLNLMKNVSRDIITDVMIRQLIRSGTSIGANVTEGRASASKKDFINFHLHALKSARETVYWLRLLHTNISENFLLTECEKLTEEARELSKIIGKIIITSRNNNKV